MPVEMSFPSDPAESLQPSGVPGAGMVGSGPTGTPGPQIPPSRTREFPPCYDTSPDVPGPLGPLNTGYVHNVVSDNAMWARGDLPPLGYNYAFALRRPRFMREPRTDLGTYYLAKG